MYNKENINWLHLENTTRCNAHCPFCARNKNGFGLKSGFQEQDIENSVFEKILLDHKNLNTVQFCGSFGDPIASKNFMELINITLKYKNIKRIVIHTNGSIKTPKFWGNLIKTIKHLEHQIIFGIDGLKDTNHIHRQNTNFDKIIENATAVIKEGGFAEWQFIVFKHNEHQVIDAYKLSKKLGFKKFTRKTAVIKSIALNFKTGIPYEILPSNLVSYKNYENKSENNFIDQEKCDHLKYKQIYVDVKGAIYPCCYLIRDKEKKYISNKKWNISEEFLSKSWNKSCLKNCGVKK